MNTIRLLFTLMLLKKKKKNLHRYKKSITIHDSLPRIQSGQKNSNFIDFFTGKKKPVDNKVQLTKCHVYTTGRDSES